MQIGGVNNTAIGTAVWATTTRNLTGLSAACIAGFTSIHQTLANGAGVDLRPAVNKLRDVVVLGEALANVTWAPSLFDGVTNRQYTIPASGAATLQNLQGNSTFGPSLVNNGTVSGSYNVAGWDWGQ